MRVLTWSAALLAAAALAGCSFGGGAESSGVDKSAYDGGAGVALALANDGRDSFDVLLTLTAANGSVAAEINATLAPGETVERWYSLAPGSYTARLTYVWSTPGHTARGDDQQVIHVQDCPEVTRVAWTLLQTQDNLGSRFDGATCVGGSDDENG